MEGALGSIEEGLGLINALERNVRLLVDTFPIKNFCGELI